MAGVANARRSSTPRRRRTWHAQTPALQLPAVFNSAVGRQLCRAKDGGIEIRCAIAAFGYGIARPFASAE